MTEIKIEGVTREQVASFLPCAIQKVFESYRSFMVKDANDTDSKKFKEQHSAGKVAVAHMELLFKLAQDAGIELSHMAADEDEIRMAIEECERHREEADAMDGDGKLY
ncbi:MAG: hypothetical protein WC989_04615 [Micavibrio sp.]